MNLNSIVTNLLREVEKLARDQDADRVVGVTLRLGARAGIIPARLREHFTEAARGSLAEDSMVEIIEDSNPSAAHAEQVTLEKIDVQ